MLVYENLEGTDLETIYEAFAGAFADYVVDIRMTVEKLTDMLERRGFEPRASVGAFDEGRLVGFILNGIRQWNGALTCYDTGTGVLPSHRGRGISKRLLGGLTDILKELEVRQYLLEVIQENEPAYELYLDSGFEVTRSLLCHQLSSRNELVTKKVVLSTAQIIELAEPQWDLFERFWTCPPSWQNSIDSLRAKLDDFILLGVSDEGRIVGYGFIHRRSGDIPQFAISENHRRRGLGSRLMRELVARSNAEPIKVLNIDERDPATHEFLTAQGFTGLVEQFEMLKPLTP